MAQAPAPAPGRRRVTSATFLDVGGGSMHVQVAGEDFVARAVPLTARLGDQDVRRVSVRADGRGFAGILERAPRDGDRLFVGYADEELEGTDVVYRGGSAPRVA